MSGLDKDCLVYQPPLDRWSLPRLEKQAPLQGGSSVVGGFASPVSWTSTLVVCWDPTGRGKGTTFKEKNRGDREVVLVCTLAGVCVLL